MKKLAFLFFSLMIISSCKMSDMGISAPKVNSPSGSRVSFNHANFLKESCVQCHENKRPVSTPPHGQGADCITCHTASPGASGAVSWKNVTNFNHDPLPNSCVSCHESKRPTDISPHLFGQWGQKEDCASCHTYPAWKTAKFDHAKPLVSCIECHRSATKDDRPIPKISHPSDTYNKLDCVLCHTNATNNKKWIDVVFNHNTHTPNPTSCTTCHESTRPAGHKVLPTVVSGMDKGDCKSCHMSTTDWKQTMAFDHESAKPTSCIGCHATNIPANQPKHPSTIGSYNKIDCMKCHTYEKVTSPRSWAKLTFNHKTHLPNPSSCLDCHKTVNNSLPASGSHLTGSRLNKDCAVCHKFDTVKPWKNFTGFNHIAIEINERCDSCHKAGSLTLKYKPVNHVATTLDCTSCHTTTAWKPASFKHSTSDTNCVSCHNGTNATGRPVAHNLNLTNHQCSSCHTQVAFKPYTFNTTYKHASTGGMPPKGTSYHKSQSSCTTCHQVTTDSVKYTNTLANSSLNPKCAGCHTSEYKPSKHGNKTIATNANCLSCHSYNGW